jgi:hypothetical protein
MLKSTLVNQFLQFHDSLDLIGWFKGYAYDSLYLQRFGKKRLTRSSAVFHPTHRTEIIE